MTTPYEDKKNDYNHQTRVDHVHHKRQPKAKTVTRQKKAVRRGLRHQEHQVLNEMTHLPAPSLSTTPLHTQAETLLADSGVEDNILHMEEEVRTRRAQSKHQTIPKEKRIPLGEWVKETHGDSVSHQAIKKR